MKFELNTISAFSVQRAQREQIVIKMQNINLSELTPDHPTSSLIPA